MHRLPSVGSALFLAAFLFVASANASTISALVNPISGGTSRTDVFEQAGFGFAANPSGTATINQLGYYDGPNDVSGSVGDGLQVAHDVGLLHYNGDGTYTVLARATVAAGTGATLSGGYRWASIPDLTLTDTSQGGDYYVLLASEGPDVWSTGGVVAAPGQTFGTLQSVGWAVSGSPIPAVGASEAIFFGSDTQFGGPNMGFVAVPEPGTIALLATGLIGLLCYAWRKRG